MTSYVLGHKISISEKSIATLLGHDGSGKKCFSMTAKNYKIAHISKFIFKNENPSSNSKDLHDDFRICFKIILECICHIPSSNSQDYINTDQKYMVYYLENW